MALLDKSLNWTKVGLKDYDLGGAPPAGVAFELD